jgi:hypothetical protein
MKAARFFFFVCLAFSPYSSNYLSLAEVLVKLELGIKAILNIFDSL